MSRTPSRRLLAVGGVALVTLLVVAGVLALRLPGDEGSPTDGAAPTPTPTQTVAPTPLAGYDTDTVAVRRQAFCEALPAEAVDRALGGPVADSRSYGDGQRVRLGGGRDIAHEYGCVFSGGGAADGSTARAWVFAPPVTPEQARGLVRAAVRPDGCERLRPAPDFGSVSTGVTCREGRGADASLEASYRGLFGDAWLSCSITGPLPRATAAERTGEWCVAVAQAASDTVPEPTSTDPSR